jgi:hypothetical protein
MKRTYLSKEQIQALIEGLPRKPNDPSKDQLRQRIQELAILILTKYLKNAVRG